MYKKRLVGTIFIKDNLVVQSISFKQYLPIGTPEVAIESGSNYLVIGRPITQSENPASKLRVINGLI